MNDLDLIRAFGELIDADAPTAPAARIRHRVVTAMSTTTPRMGRRRASFIGTATVAAVLAVGVAIISALPGARPDGGRQHAGPVTPAREQPPEPDAFIYTRMRFTERTVDAGGSVGPEVLEDTAHDTPVGAEVVERNEYTEERWWPVDGSTGVLTSSEHGTRLECGTDGPLARTIRPGDPCTIDPGYAVDLPTDAPAMLAHLRAGPDTGAGPEPDDSVNVHMFDTALELLAQRMVPPATRQVIFDALASVPEHEVVPDVELDGRTGTAVVAFLENDKYRERRDLVFDHRTYDLIGLRVTAYTDRGTPLVGSIVATVDERALVPDVRLRPDGTRNTRGINTRSYIRYRAPDRS